MQALSFVRTHHRASSASKLGPLLSECYTTVSTHTCKHTLPCKSIIYIADLDHIQNVGPRRRTSLPLRLGSLPSESYTTTSVRSHNRTSIPLRLGPLPRECYSMESTYKCSYTLHTRVMSAKHILTTCKCRPVVY